MGAPIHVRKGGPALWRLRKGKRTEDAAAEDPAEGWEDEGRLPRARSRQLCGFSLSFLFFFSYICLDFGLIEPCVLGAGKAGGL